MQHRHLNRKQYFYELSNTAREFYMEFLPTYITLTSETRILEIGCGEGGNLLPFAEKGCRVTGMDICQVRINEARTFFAQCHQRGTFICKDFLLADKQTNDEERYDLILVHDVIEHIAPSCKREFFLHVKDFLRVRGIVFFGFPVWQNPFGGHQQISVGLTSKLPFVHLMPKPIYRTMLKLSGNTSDTINELIDIRASRMTIEHFEQLTLETGYTICRRMLWLINPHYKQKFHINPRRLWAFFANIRFLRNFYTTSAWYLLRLS